MWFPLLLKRLLILSLLVLNSCSSPWIKVSDSYNIVTFKEVIQPGKECNKLVTEQISEDSLGCTVWHRQTKTAEIFIEKRLKPENKECVRTHELKHADGYDHEHWDSVLNILCGDGSFQSFEGLNNE